ERARPLFVGFSTITGPQLRPVIAASKRVKALGVPVVWGGVHATIMPEECLREPYVDYVVVNEGEQTAVELAHLLAGSAPHAPEHVLGLGDRKSTRLNSSHVAISYAVFCLKKKKKDVSILDKTRTITVVNRQVLEFVRF